MPPYDIKVSGTREKPTILDCLRRRYVALTPEEWVRQHFTHYLTECLGYPAALMAHEVELRCGPKRVRCDGVLYDQRLRPRMLMEYKAPTVRLSQHVFDQITAYNMLLHVDYLIVSNGLEHYCCHMDYAHRTYGFLREIPPYSSLVTIQR